MIAAHPPQRTVESRWIEAPDFDSETRQTSKKSARGIAQRTDPIIEKTDLYSLSGFAGQKIGKHQPRFVFVNDVAFEMNPFSGRFYGVDPCRVVGLRILQKPHPIAQDQRRSGSARKRLIM